MTKFELVRMSRIGSPIRYWKLIRAGKCLYDDFERSINKNGNYEAQFDKIQVFIERDSEGEMLPSSAIKELKRDKGDKIRDYEFRTPKLRVYFFRDEESGNIIVLGGIKDPKGQERDIATLRRIKKEYFEQKNSR